MPKKRRERMNPRKAAWWPEAICGADTRCAAADSGWGGRGGALTLFSVSPRAARRVSLRGNSVPEGARERVR